jgi:hypothetical protein
MSVVMTQDHVHLFIFRHILQRLIHKLLKVFPRFHLRSLRLNTPVATFKAANKFNVL